MTTRAQTVQRQYIHIPNTYRPITVRPVAIVTEWSDYEPTIEKLFVVQFNQIHHSSELNIGTKFNNTPK